MNSKRYLVISLFISATFSMHSMQLFRKPPTSSLIKQVGKAIISYNSNKQKIALAIAFALGTKGGYNRAQVDAASGSATPCTPGHIISLHIGALGFLTLGSYFLPKAWHCTQINRSGLKVNINRINVLGSAGALFLALCGGSCLGEALFTMEC